MKREELRKTILAQRDQLPQSFRTQASATIAERLWQLVESQKAQTLLFYVNFRSEVETLRLMGRCLEAGKTVAAPLTITEDSRLLAYGLTDLSVDLRPGLWNIPEPDLSRCPQIDPTSIDLVIVPGSVFDRHGGRLGYGGGYYDRFLCNKAPQALRVALCYAMQIVDNVPVEEHDIPAHYVVTEEATFKSS